LVTLTTEGVLFLNTSMLTRSSAVISGRAPAAYGTPQQLLTATAAAASTLASCCCTRGWGSCWRWARDTSPRAGAVLLSLRPPLLLLLFLSCGCALLAPLLPHAALQACLGGCLAPGMAHAARVRWWCMAGVL
jgi:hypothetical protein